VLCLEPEGEPTTEPEFTAACEPLVACEPARVCSEFPDSLPELEPAADPASAPTVRCLEPEGEPAAEPGLATDSEPRIACEPRVLWSALPDGSPDLEPTLASVPAAFCPELEAEPTADPELAAECELLVARERPGVCSELPDCSPELEPAADLACVPTVLRPVLEAEPTAEPEFSAACEPLVAFEPPDGCSGFANCFPDCKPAPGTASAPTVLCPELEAEPTADPEFTAACEPLVAFEPPSVVSEFADFSADLKPAADPASALTVLCTELEAEPELAADPKPPVACEPRVLCSEFPDGSPDLEPAADLASVPATLCPELESEPIAEPDMAAVCDPLVALEPGTLCSELPDTCPDLGRADPASAPAALCPKLEAEPIADPEMAAVCDPLVALEPEELFSELPDNSTDLERADPASAPTVRCPKLETDPAGKPELAADSEPPVASLRATCCLELPDCSLDLEPAADPAVTPAVLCPVPEAEPADKPALAAASEPAALCSELPDCSPDLKSATDPSAVPASLCLELEAEPALDPATEPELAADPEPLVACERCPDVELALDLVAEPALPLPADVDLAPEAWPAAAAVSKPLFPREPAAAPCSEAACCRDLSLALDRVAETPFVCLAPGAWPVAKPEVATDSEPATIFCAGLADCCPDVELAMDPVAKPPLLRLTPEVAVDSEAPTSRGPATVLRSKLTDCCPDLEPTTDPIAEPPVFRIAPETEPAAKIEVAADSEPPVPCGPATSLCLELEDCCPDLEPSVDPIAEPRSLRLEEEFADCL